MHVLILGGAGFIGSHLAGRLCREHAVTVMDLNCSSLVEQRLPVRLIELDLTRPLRFSESEGWDQVYLLAAVVGVGVVERDPMRALRVNTRIVLEVLDWLPPGTRLFFASTSEVYAGSVMAGIAPVPTPETVPLSVPDLVNPRFAYGVSKMLGEAAVLYRGANAVIGRFHNIYGPRMGWDHAIPALTRRLASTAPLVPIYGADQTRAFCYIEDAVDAMIALMATDYRGVVNIGNDREELTIEALAGEIAAVLDLDDVLIERRPAPSGSVSRRCPDLSHLRALTGYEPRVALRQGLIPTVDWILRSTPPPAPTPSPTPSQRHRRMIALAEPSVQGLEMTACVIEAIEAGDIAIGPHIARFEAIVAEFTGAKYVIAVSSGTAALHVALLAAGVQPGHQVIVPATTFIATANAIRYCGAEPVILDVEPDTWGLDPEQVAEYLSHHHAEVRAMIPVHLYGHPCRIDSLRGLARRYGIAVIEDAAEALGARYKDVPIGSEGLVTLSFNGNKLITTGGGGMVLTDDATTDARVRALINQDVIDRRLLIYGAGFNYRMPNLNAAFGVDQMRTIYERLAAKRATAAHYQSALPGVFREQPWACSSYWLPAILVEDAETTRQSLRSFEIEARRIWRPLHWQPAFGGLARTLPVAEMLYTRGLVLPSSVDITPEERERVIVCLNDASPAPSPSPTPPPTPSPTPPPTPTQRQRP